MERRDGVVVSVAGLGRVVLDWVEGLEGVAGDIGEGGDEIERLGGM